MTSEGLLERCTKDVAIVTDFVLRDLGDLGGEGLFGFRMMEFSFVLVLAEKATKTD
jgi:hypothetical protein